MNEECRTCRFFVLHNQWQGECRRLPPQFTPHDMNHFGSWPYVDPDSWCGEYSQKPDPHAPPPPSLDTGVDVVYP